MGDRRRFNLFAKLVEKHISKNDLIADVAGGKGYLQAALSQLGYKNIVSIDKRKKYAKGRKNYRYGYFAWNTSEKFDAIIGMHPDEATDHIILYAAKHKVKAIVCPCCVKPSAQTYWGQHSYNNWMQHLKNLAQINGLNVQECRLPMDGKNQVLILT